MNERRKRWFAESSLAISCLILALLTLCPTAGRAWCETAPTVAIDAGHSLKNPGTPSSRNVGEYTFNSNMAKLLLDKLRTSNIKPVLINEDGEDISLTRRVGLINREKPDLLFSIHHDSVQPIYLVKWMWNGKPAWYCDKYSGFSVFYSEKNRKSSESLRLARLLGKAMVDEGFRPSLHHAEKIKGENRQIVDAATGIYRFDGLVVLKSANCPGVLLECGIIRNRQDELLLGSAAARLKIATAVRKAISELTGK